MSGYTVISVEDAPDVLGDYPGEMRFLTGALEAEQGALTYRRMPPSTDISRLSGSPESLTTSCPDCSGSP